MYASKSSYGENSPRGGDGDEYYAATTSRNEHFISLSSSSSSSPSASAFSSSASLVLSPLILPTSLGLGQHTANVDPSSTVIIPEAASYGTMNNNSSSSSSRSRSNEEDENGNSDSDEKNLLHSSNLQQQQQQIGNTKNSRTCCCFGGRSSNNSTAATTTNNYKRYSFDLVFVRRLFQLVWLALTPPPPPQAPASTSSSSSYAPRIHVASYSSLSSSSSFTSSQQQHSAIRNRKTPSPQPSPTTAKKDDNNNSSNSSNSNNNNNNNRDNRINATGCNYERYRTNVRSRVQLWLVPLVLLCVTVGSMLMGNQVGQLSGFFYRAIINKDLGQFKQVLWQGALWIAGISLVNGVQQVLQEAFALLWRESLTVTFHRYYFSNDSFYRALRGVGVGAIQQPTSISTKKKKKKKKTNTTGAAALIDNPDQRIAQDIDTFTTRFADIVVKAFNAPLQIVWYSVTTYRNLGWLGPVVCYAFFLLGSLVNKVLISPLVGLVFAQDQCEGNFRFSHVYLRTHAESVAFYRGEARERQVNDSYLWLLVANKWRIVRRHFPLYLHQQLFGYIGSILNYVIIGYAVFYRGYFAGDNAGEVGMKISQASFACLMLLYGFTNFIQLGSDVSDLAGYTARLGEMWETLVKLNNSNSSNDTTTISTATTNRTITSTSSNSINDNNDQDQQETNKDEDEGEGDYIEFKNVSCYTPAGKCLFKGISFRVDAVTRSSSSSLASSSSLLIMGPSGCGKSSLLRVLSGLWPRQQYEGTIHRPPRATLEGIRGVFYIPQQPYINLGTLRDQITYPLDRASSLAVPEEHLREILDMACLPYLVERLGGSLDSVLNLPEILSPGEKQRLCFARLFFHRPKFAVLDEATSALSVDTEERLYQQCVGMGIALISCGHRPSLAKFHSQVLHLTMLLEQEQEQEQPAGL